MSDHYTKFVLTVIAIALSIIAIKPVSMPARAQSGCGEYTYTPCYVVVKDSVEVSNVVTVRGKVSIRGPVETYQ